MGRWTSADPSGHKDDAGYYGYVGGRPINAFDPDGNEGFWSNAWEVTKGVGSGVANTASGIKQMVTHPIETAKAIGTQMQEEYRKEGGGVGGVIMAANVVNPAYHAMVAGYETYQAVQRGDYHAAGEQGFNTVLQTASTVLVATGGAGALSRGFTRAPVGAAPKPVPAAVPKPVPAAMPKPVPAAIPKPTPAAVPKALPPGPTPKGLLPPKGGTTGAPKGAPARVPDLVIDEYANLRTRTDIPGQAHHLNQDAAFGKVVPQSKGVSAKLEGNAFTEPGSPHFEAHGSLEQFWNQYRRGGAKFGQRPTNTEYTLALQRSLRAARLPEQQVQQAVRAATRQRVDYGLLGGEQVPRIPGRINQVR